MPIFNVDATLFRAVALFESTDPIRYYLRGVHIEPHPQGGAIMVATDGTALIAAHDTTATCEGEHIVHMGKAGLAASRTPRGGAPLRIAAYDTEVAWVEDGEGTRLHTTRDWRVDGTYPDWRRVLPSSPPAGSRDPVAFNAEYLARFGEAAGLTGTKGRTIRLHTGRRGRPTVVRLPSVDHIVGLIMPIRSDPDAGVAAFLGGLHTRHTMEIDQ